MKTTLISIIILVCFNLSAQSLKEKYANQLFNTMNYYECSSVFEEISNKSIKENNYNINSIRRSAISFYKIKDYAKAIYFFDILDSKKALDKEDLTDYLDCLIRSKNFDIIKQKSELFNSFQIKDSSLLDLNAYQQMLSIDSAKYTLSKMKINSGKGEYAAYQKGDDLYFSSSKTELGQAQKKYGWDNLNYSNVYVTSLKTDTNSSYLIRELTSKYHEGPVTFLDSTIYLTRSKFGKSKKKKTANVGVYFGKIGTELTPLKFNSESYNVGHVAFSKDGNTMYFVSDTEGGFGGSDIYYSKKENGEWQTPVNFGAKINTPGDEMFPYIDSMGGIYFSSNGKIGFGGLDIYFLKNGSENSINLGEPINSGGDDFAFILTNKEKSGYLSSDRIDFMDKIYSFKVNEITRMLTIEPIDYISKKRLGDIDIFIVDTKTGEKTRVNKNENDEYVVPIKSDSEYYVEGTKKNFEQVEKVKVSGDNIKNGKLPIAKLEMSQNATDIKVHTVDSLTNLPIAGVYIELSTKHGEILKFTTDSSGVAFVNIKADTSYNVFATKKGYLDVNSKFDFTDSAVIKLNLNLVKIKKDVTFEIENLLFDYGKYDLREDSKKELDKLSEFLKTNNTIKIELSSHTDSRYGKEFNYNLSKNRSKSCLDYLLSQGIDARRIRTKAYGESRLLNRCSDGVECSEEEHQVNRRTEIKILSVK